MGFSGQEYWSGLSFPSPGDLSSSGIERRSLALAGGFFTTEPPATGLPSDDDIIISGHVDCGAAKMVVFGG